ncbi:MAG: serine/threonine-protein kinase, partial [Planctomycetaceae bacterium]
MRFFGNSQSLSIAMLQEIDQICDAFEAAWRRGERPVVKDYIPNWTGQERDVLLREILALDVDYRMRRGEMPDEQEYTSGIANSAHIVAELFRPIPKNRETVVENRPTRFDGGGPKDSAGRPSPPSGSSVDPNIGRVVGNFQIVSYLGGGGMGAVYRARHTMIQCERAVKVLQPALASHADAVRRFLREAQAAIDSLNHQNIVKAFDVGMDGKEVYLVMEVVDGEDLARTVGRSGPFPAEKAAELIEYAANGLAVAHAAGFVHRDIKPQNLMLTRDGVLKILDLGLIRLLEDPDEKEKTAEAAQSGSLAPMSIFASQLTDGRAILGTLAYMSPEQARSPGDADGRSDIYS